MNNNNNIIDDNGDKVVKSEEGTMEEMCNNLNINLSEIDDSSIWPETQATSPFQVAMSDVGIFYGNYENSKDWDGINYPLELKVWNTK